MRIAKVGYKSREFEAGRPVEYAKPSLLQDAFDTQLLVSLSARGALDQVAAQGRGLGSALLDQMLARVDADSLPVYLESSNERNIALYGRHGFEMTSEVAIPGGPRIWPMWREPRA